MSGSKTAGGTELTQASFQRFFLFALLILLIRVISLWFNNSDLFFDEAQYWVWGKEPAFGYFSKPPLLAAIIGVFTSVCGDSEFCVRLPSPVFHTATAVFVFLAAKRLFDVKVGYVAGLNWLLLPAVSLSSTLISTDVPLLLCWSIALYGFVRFQEDQALKWALLIAAAFGLGLNAKYAMAYFLLCAILYGILVGDGRKVLKAPLFWLAIGLGICALVPNIIWNFQNSFTTVTHTGENIGWGGGFPHLDRLAEFAGSQFGVVGPVLFAIYLIALFRFSREGASREQKLLVWFSLPVLLLICVQAVMAKAYANWAATAFPALVILVSQLFVQVVPPIWSRISNLLHLAVFAVLAVAVAFAGPGQLPLPEKSNPFNRMWGGHELGQAMAMELEKGIYTHVLSDSRKRSATLIYYLRDRPESVLAFRENATPHDHFELTRALQDRDAASLKDAVMLYPSYSGKVPKSVANVFDKVEQVISLPRYSGSGKQMTLFSLQGYHGQK